MNYGLVRMVPARRLKEHWISWIDHDLAALFVREKAAVYVGSDAIVKLYNKRTLRDLVFMRDHYTCVYCGDTDVPLTLDHIHPRCRGGRSTPLNVVTACYFCNQTKATRDLTGFFLTMYSA